VNKKNFDNSLGSLYNRKHVKQRASLRTQLQMYDITTWGLDRVGGSPTLCSGGPGNKFWLGHRLSWDFCAFPQSVLADAV